jgi:hypothetical protein
MSRKAGDREVVDMPGALVVSAPFPKWPRFEEETGAVVHPAVPR